MCAFVQQLESTESPVHYAYDGHTHCGLQGRTQI